MAYYNLQDKLKKKEQEDFQVPKVTPTQTSNKVTSSVSQNDNGDTVATVSSGNKNYNITFSQPMQIGDTSTAAGMEAAIWNSTKPNSMERNNLYAQLDEAYRTPGSQYYRPYTVATNQSFIDDLAARGVDVSGGINDDLFARHANYQQYLTTTDVSGGVSTTGKKKWTNEQWIAYDMYRLQQDEDTTKKVESEWDGLQKELIYYAKKGLTNDEIKAKIDWNKYKTLQKLDDTAKIGTPTLLNRATTYSQDSIDGVIWNARNGRDEDPFKAAIYYQMGSGATDNRNKKAQMRRTPGSADYNPYVDGATNDKYRMMFDVPTWDMNWLTQNQQRVYASGDDDQIKAYQKMWDIEATTEAAENELETLKKRVTTAKYDDDYYTTQLSEGKTPRELAEARVSRWLEGDELNKFNTLKKMDSERQKGGYLELSRSVNYRYEDIVNEVEEQIRRANNLNASPVENVQKWMQEKSKELQPGIDTSVATGGSAVDTSVSTTAEPTFAPYSTTKKEEFLKNRQKNPSFQPYFIEVEDHLSGKLPRGMRVAAGGNVQSDVQFEGGNRSHYTGNGSGLRFQSLDTENIYGTDDLYNTLGKIVRGEELNAKEQDIATIFDQSLTWAFRATYAGGGLALSDDAYDRRGAVLSAGKTAWAVVNSLNNEYAKAQDLQDAYMQLFLDGNEAYKAGVSLEEYYKQNKGELDELQAITTRVKENESAAKQAYLEQQEADKQARADHMISLLGRYTQGEELTQDDANLLYALKPTTPDQANTVFWDDDYLMTNVYSTGDPSNPGIRELLSAENERRMIAGEDMIDYDEWEAIQEAVESYFAFDANMAKAAGMTTEEFYEKYPDMKRSVQDVWNEVTERRKQQNDPTALTPEEKEGLGFWMTLGKGVEIGANTWWANNVGFFADTADMLEGETFDVMQRSDNYQSYVADYGPTRARSQFRTDLNTYIKSLRDSGNEDKAALYEQMIADADANDQDIFSIPINFTKEELKDYHEQQLQNVQDAWDYVNEHGTLGEIRAVSTLSSATNSIIGSTVSAVFGGALGSQFLGTAVGFGLGSFDSSYREFYEATGDKGAAALYGLVMAGVETITEGEQLSKYYNFAGNSLSDLIQGYMKDEYKKGGLKALTGFLITLGSNAVEEVGQELGQNAIENAINAIAYGDGSYLYNITDPEQIRQTVASTLLTVGLNTTMSSSVGAAANYYQSARAKKQVQQALGFLSAPQQAEAANDNTFLRVTAGEVSDDEYIEAMNDSLLELPEAEQPDQLPSGAKPGLPAPVENERQLPKEKPGLPPAAKPDLPAASEEEPSALKARPTPYLGTQGKQFNTRIKTLGGDNANLGVINEAYKGLNAKQKRIVRSWSDERLLNLITNSTSGDQVTKETVQDTILAEIENDNRPAEEVAPATEKVITPPAEEVAPVPTAEEVVTPATEEIVTPPAEEVVTPPAEEVAPAPATEEIVTPPAEEAVPTVTEPQTQAKPMDGDATLAMYEERFGGFENLTHMISEYGTLAQGADFGIAITENDGEAMTRIIEDILAKNPELNQQNSTAEQAAPSAEATAPTEEVVTPPAEEAAPIPAAEETAPTEEVVTPPAEEVTTPPAEEVAPAPATEEVAPTPAAEEAAPTPTAEEQDSVPPEEIDFSGEFLYNAKNLNELNHRIVMLQNNLLHADPKAKRGIMMDIAKLVDRVHDLVRLMDKRVPHNINSAADIVKTLYETKDKSLMKSFLEEIKGAKEWLANRVNNELLVDQVIKNLYTNANVKRALKLDKANKLFAEKVAAGMLQDQVTRTSARKIEELGQNKLQIQESIESAKEQVAQAKKNLVDAKAFFKQNPLDLNAAQKVNACAEKVKDLNTKLTDTRKELEKDGADYDAQVEEQRSIMNSRMRVLYNNMRDQSAAEADVAVEKEADRALFATEPDQPVVVPPVIESAPMEELTSNAASEDQKVVSLEEAFAGEPEERNMESISDQTKRARQLAKELRAEGSSTAPTNYRVQMFQDYLNNEASNEMLDRITDLSDEDFKGLLSAISSAKKKEIPGVVEQYMSQWVNEDVANDTVTTESDLSNPDTLPSVYAPIARTDQLTQQRDAGQHTFDQEQTNNKGKRQFANETAQGSWIPDWLQDELQADPELANYDIDSNNAQMDRASQRIHEKGPWGVVEELQTKFENGNGHFDKDDQAAAILLLLYATHEKDNDLALTVAGMYDIMGTEAGQTLQARKIFQKLTPAGARTNAARQGYRANRRARQRNPRQYNQAREAAKRINQSLQGLPSGGESSSDNKWNIELNPYQQELIKQYHLENETRPGIFYNRATIRQRMLEAIIATPNVFSATNEGLSLADRLEMLDRGIPVVTNADLNYIGSQMGIFVGEGSFGGGDAAHTALARAYEANANITPSTLGEKFRTFRYVNMLLSVPTTLRNVLGNFTQNAVNDVSHGIAAGLDAGVSLFTGKRTVGTLTAEQRIAGWKSFVHELANTYTDYFTDRAVAPQVEASQVAGEALDPANRFNTNSRNRTYQNSVLEARTTLENFLMSAGDRPVWAKHFRNSLDEQMNVEGNTVATQEQIERAIADANYSTFTEDNALATALNNFKRNAGAAGVVLDWLMPFTGVPSNIMRRMYQYSPLSLISTGVKHAVSASRGTFDQRTFVTEMARGLTGTGMTALGILAAQAGLIKFGTADEDDDRKRGLRTANGEQYSPFIYNPFTNRYVSLSTFNPAVTPILLGSVIHDLFKDDPDVGNIVLGAITAEVDSIIDASYLSGLQNVMTAYQQGGVGEAAVAMVGSGISSLTPATGAQIASALDPYVRDTYDKSSIMKAINTGVINRIPVVRQMLLPEKVDITGQAVENYKKGLENLINPLTVSPARDDEAINELLRLSDALGDSSFLPSDALSGKRDTVTGVARPLTGKEKETYKKRYGTLAFDGGETKDSSGNPVHVTGIRQLMASPAYADLPDEEKAKEIKAIVNAAKNGTVRETKDTIGETEKAEKAKSNSDRVSIGARPDMVDKLYSSSWLDLAYQTTLDGRFYPPTRQTTFTRKDKETKEVVEYKIDDKFNAYYLDQINQRLLDLDTADKTMDEIAALVDNLYNNAFNATKNWYVSEYGR